MQTVTRENVVSLLGISSSPCVSLYLPLHHGSEAVQNSVSFKNLLRTAQDQLIAAGYTEEEVVTWLKPAQQLEDLPGAWQHTGEGLAAFICRGEMQTFSLPAPVHEQVKVGPSFQIRPLIPLLSPDGPFYVLTLSHNSVKLFEGTRDNLIEIEPGNVPRSLAEAMQYDDRDRQLQYHSGGAGKPALYFGLAEDNEDDKDKLLRFFQQIDASLPTQSWAKNAPLVVACVDYLFPIFSKVNRYAYLLPQTIQGNPDRMPVTELHRRALELLEPVFAEPAMDTLDRLGQWNGSGLASSDVVEVIRAAHTGRIRTLLLGIDAECWGTYSPATCQAVVHSTQEPGDVDLANLAAIKTLQSRGEVYSIDPELLPDSAPVAALFRY